MAVSHSLRSPLWTVTSRIFRHRISGNLQQQMSTDHRSSLTVILFHRRSPFIHPACSVRLSPALSLHTSSSPCAKKGKKHKPKVDTNISADEDILNIGELKEDMQKIIDTLKQDYTKSLSIRTSQGSLDHIIVSTPEGKFPLNQLGQITHKSASLMTVNLSSFPHVKEATMKAILEAGMNLNPIADGNVIQVPIPKVSREHRDNLAKSAKGMCDKSKVSLRNVRSKYVAAVKKQEKSTQKDTIFRLEKQIQHVADIYSEAAEGLLAAKTRELSGK